MCELKQRRNGLETCCKAKTSVQVQPLVAMFWSVKTFKQIEELNPPMSDLIAHFRVLMGSRCLVSGSLSIVSKDFQMKNSQWNLNQPDF